jgi:hypothetical protein
MPKKKRLLRPARVFDHHGTVPPGPTKDVLLQGLEDAGTSFEPGELAYLAVTSKVELPVRDRFAWELHRRLKDRSLLVAREWRRADLAVVRDGDAVVIIEGTALYAFDLLREPGLHKYRAKVTGDLAKAAALAPHADAYALVLCTHVLGEIAPQLKRWVVKYSSGIIGAAKSHGDAGQEAVRQSLRGELNQLGPSDYRQMPSGSVWGLDVVVDAWLVGPISRPRLEQEARHHSG